MPEKNHLEACITEVDVYAQQNDNIFFIDPDNHQYEDLSDDMMDEAGEDEFDASNNDHCTNIDDDSNELE